MHNRASTKKFKAAWIVGKHPLTHAFTELLKTKLPARVCPEEFLLEAELLISGIQDKTIKPEPEKMRSYRRYRNLFEHSPQLLSMIRVDYIVMVCGQPIPNDGAEGEDIAGNFPRGFREEFRKTLAEVYGVKSPGA